MSATTLHAGRARASAMPNPAASSGPGWQIIQSPMVPHDALDAHARNVWHFTFHGQPWPHGWAVKWATLDNRALGRCLYQEKLVLVDEARMRGRTGPELVEVLVHEFAHVLHKEEAVGGNPHGRRFSNTLLPARVEVGGLRGVRAMRPRLRLARADAAVSALRVSGAAVVTGRVARYDESVGYGFLVAEDGRSYFLHRTAIVSRPLHVGDVVDFVPDEGSRWPRARGVRRLATTTSSDAPP